MKTLTKTIAAVVLAATVATPVLAEGGRHGVGQAPSNYIHTGGHYGGHHGHHGHRGGNDWIGPVIGGVILGAILTQPRQETVIVQQPVPVQPSYSYRPMYKAVDVYVPECACYRTVYVQVN